MAPEVAYLLASFGSLAVALLPLLEKLRTEHFRRPKEVGRYFESLADSLSKISTELSEKRVPRIDGTALNLLLQSFETKTRPIERDALPPKLNAMLLGAAKAAKTLDAWAVDRIQLEDEHRAQLLANIQRAAGTCRAIAVKLSADA